MINEVWALDNNANQKCPMALTTGPRWPIWSLFCEQMSSEITVLWKQDRMNRLYPSLNLNVVFWPWFISLLTLLEIVVSLFFRWHCLKWKQLFKHFRFHNRLLDYRMLSNLAGSFSGLKCIMPLIHKVKLDNSQRKRNKASYKKKQYHSTCSNSQ